MPALSPSPVRTHDRQRWTLFVVAIAVAALALPFGLVHRVDAGTAANEPIRFATFNASLNRNVAGQLRNDLSTTTNAQAAAVAEIIQRTTPDVLLINEFDYDPAAVDLFRSNYLAVPHNGAPAVSYPYAFIAPSNTGVPSGLDFNNNGSTSDPDDAYGFGFFPGQFGMLVLSKYPIATHSVRTFQEFLWRDMPGALLPDDPATAAPSDWYSDAELAVFRLSSKSHWDVPIEIGATTVHFLVSHPTPPVFDGAEDRNGTRNHDEIRLWADYVTPGAADYLYDDAGVHGGLAPGSKFVIAGDQNSDPLDGDSIPGSAQQLLDNPRINTTVAPSSEGGTFWADVQGALNDIHESDPAFDTADFCDTAAPPPCSGPGNLRADYVLPSRSLRITDAGVFWPTADDPLVRLTGSGFPVPSSDHRLVWVDAHVPGSAGG